MKYRPELFYIKQMEIFASRPLSLGILLSIGAILSLVITPKVIQLALKWGIVDTPDARKVHAEPMPRMGGVAIFISFLIAFLLASPWFDYANAYKLGVILTGGAFIFGIGLLDDIKDLSAKFKFLAQILVALFVASQGIIIGEVNFPFLDAPFVIPTGLAWVVTVFWIVGVCNAINLMDGLDGLAAGISLIVLVTISGVAIMNKNHLVVWASIPLIGVLLGFLRFNFHPAKTFMGDCGSLYLGYMLATLSLLNSSLETSTVSLIMPVVALGLPIFDTVFSMIRRVLIGRKMFTPDKEHVHHQILKKGFTHKQTVLILYLIASAFCILSFAMIALQNKGLAALILLYPIMFYWLVRKLGYLGKIANFRIRWVRHLTRSIYSKEYRHNSMISQVFRYITHNNVFLRGMDLLGWSFSWCFALLFVHQEIQQDPAILLSLWQAHSIYLVFLVIAFQLWLCYIDIWRFLEFNGIGRFYKASSIAMISFYLLAPFLASSPYFTSRFFVLLWIMNIVWVTFFRMIHNYYFNFMKREASYLKNGANVLIYGAGDNAKLMQTLFTRMDNLQYNLIGFIDDDPLKQGKCIYRYPVLGNTAELSQVIKEHQVTELVFSTIPTIKNMEILQELDRKHEIKLTVFSVDLHEVHDLDDLRQTIQQKLGM